jgi:hypothetical protein
MRNLPLSCRPIAAKIRKATFGWFSISAVNLDMVNTKHTRSSSATTVAERGPASRMASSPKNSARREGRQTDSIVGRLKKCAGCTLSHDEYLPAGLAFVKNRVALPIRSALQVRLDCHQVLRIELCEQVNLRQWNLVTMELRLRIQKTVLSALDGAVNVRENICIATGRQNAETREALYHHSIARR